MKKQFHILFLFLMFGLFLPTSMYACGTNSEKSCCKTEKSIETEKKDCCNNKQSKNEDKSCGGKCGQSNCTSVSTVNYSVISFFEIDFKNNNFDFSNEKPKFHHSETFISSGFTTVWLPPKIK